MYWGASIVTMRIPEREAPVFGQNNRKYAASIYAFCTILINSMAEIGHMREVFPPPGDTLTPISLEKQCLDGMEL
jgi:hypothetical protein